jgi:hypothetical protein
MEIKLKLLFKKNKKLLFYDNFIIFVHSKLYFMKAIKILRVLINILYMSLFIIFILGILFLIAVFFFNEYLPYYLHGFKMLYSSFFDWKMFLIPFSTVVNFILFILSVYYLRKCIKPFIASDFYSTTVISNLKKAGKLFVFIGVTKILFRLISALYLINSIPIQGLSGFSFITSFTTFISSIDVTTIFLIIIGLFFLLFSNAFENAKSLKEENDLTI